MRFTGVCAGGEDAHQDLFFSLRCDLCDRGTGVFSVFGLFAGREVLRGEIVLIVLRAVCKHRFLETSRGEMFALIDKIRE